MSAKRFALGILALVLFGILLINVGRFDDVMDVAHRVLPTPSEAPTQVLSGPDITAPLEDAGLVGEGGILEPNKVVVMLDSIPATTDTDLPKYVRSAFGTPWADTDHNGCDTRNDILQRDLLDVQYRPDTDNCVIVSGILNDPYTGETIQFEKVHASEVQIDHMAPLSWAWRNGASSWDAEKRKAFANDRINLTAVDGSANQSKSDKGPADWRPDNESYRCEYVTRFVLVVKQYGLTIDDRDRQAARRQLASCN